MVSLARDATLWSRRSVSAPTGMVSRVRHPSFRRCGQDVGDLGRARQGGDHAAHGCAGLGVVPHDEAAGEVGPRPLPDRADRCWGQRHEEGPVGRHVHLCSLLLCSRGAAHPAATPAQKDVETFSLSGNGFREESSKSMIQINNFLAQLHPAMLYPLVRRRIARSAAARSSVASRAAMNASKRSRSR